MLKTSLFFVAIALIALLLADLEISTLHPWTELSRMAWGVITPDVYLPLEFETCAAQHSGFCRLWYFFCCRAWHRTGFRLPFYPCQVVLRFYPRHP